VDYIIWTAATDISIGRGRRRRRRNVCVDRANINVDMFYLGHQKIIFIAKGAEITPLNQNHLLAAIKMKATPPGAKFLYEGLFA
jgi:hypothetical protein